MHADNIIRLCFNLEDINSVNMNDNINASKNNVWVKLNN